MKAAVLHAREDIRVEEIKDPVIDSGEVLVRVKVSGICGSDIPRVLGDASRYFPNVLGHEFSGVVEAIGENVRHVSVGDKVSVAPLKPCHECSHCLSGNHALCKSYSFIGSREFGAWAELMKAPAVNVVKLPESIDFVRGAFLEPLTVALHGLFLIDMKPLKSVAITGMGTIGLLTLQCAKLMGAEKITVFDIDDEKLTIARSLGADIAINTMGDFKDIVDPAGYDYVIETAGVPVTTKLCLELAGNKGNVLYIGTPHRTFEISQAEFENINRKELYVTGSWMSYSAPFPGREWTLGAELLGNGSIEVEPLIDRLIPIEEIPKAFEDLKKGSVNGKVLMTL